MYVILKTAMFMLIIDFGTLLIGGLLREKRVKGRPLRLYAEEAPRPPAEIKRLERKSAGKFNSTKHKQEEEAVLKSHFLMTFGTAPFFMAPKLINCLLIF
ncbi:hypothetical protein CWS01_01785 [Niallia nealsonii]|uniref:Uncharacterized protein n=1 Tax=Niallia nealsonii TaxID=115979 RepID=A0A2N0Z7W0_9BACI|nr:hypothetical protein CWS01_01785 [Niallia nealsonii]